MTNPVNYFEIGTTDPQASKTFYGSMFGWNIADPSPYGMIDEDRGGLWDTSEMGGANYAIFYVQVSDVKASIEQAEQLGAKVLVPLVDNGRITFAHLEDPQGNRFGIWRPNDA